LLDKSSTQLAEADPPVVRRLRIIMRQMTTFAQNGPANKYSRYAWVMQGMFDEIMDELASDTDPALIGSWFQQFGQVIEWCGSGDDSVLPESMRGYLAEKHPEMLAITTGTNS
jgi:hypothetical protein